MLAGGGAVAAAAVGGGTGYLLGQRGNPSAEGPAADTPPLHRYVSRPDLSVPVVTITTGAGSDGGLVFLTPAAGAGGRGPLIVDASGDPVWFRQVAAPAEVATDARMQHLNDAPVLTWWEGIIDHTLGIGAGEFVIADTSYRELHRLRGAGGEPADQHELVLTEQGTALFFTCPAVDADLSALGGPAAGAVYDAVLQEVDLETGRTLWRWRALEHVELAESRAPLPGGERAGSPYDFFHANAVAVDRDGDLLVSARHTWTVYKIERATGRIRWRLGGPRSDFQLDTDAAFSWQHDVRLRHDGTIGLFDNGAGITEDATWSRGLVLDVDEQARTATLVRQMLHPDRLLAASQGNLQELTGDASFIGWGARPYFSEHAADGTVRFAGNLPADNVSYRAYRFAWSGTPPEPPAVAVNLDGPAATVYASWNGATDVRRWRVRGGAQPGSLGMLAEVDRTGFETALPIPDVPAYLAADALDADRRVLGSSPVLPVLRGTASPAASGG
ncbi:arylsulfotransferase family protein [Plantactinospora sp. KBS50]|uniref:arylsulfotransferase family protein n=1 Tax=Plantactinospora sp. KBS50 TaxID=2024580 RepID=UPI001E433DA1|nr:arylsulfotransferase family protein [Plantactinospora sp. KBS50]